MRGDENGGRRGNARRRIGGLATALVRAFTVLGVLGAPAAQADTR
ncbi:hypothetical protein [Actinomadura sp. WAC 06369]|nr:hypothetical protein [Actinomadura sp. WAC 06369]